MSDITSRDIGVPAPTSSSASPSGSSARRGDSLTATTLAMLAVMAVVSIWIVSSYLPDGSSAVVYLAWMLAGGMAGLCVAAIGSLVRTVTGGHEWTVLTRAGLVFAAFWSMVVAIAVIAGGTVSF